MFDWNITLNNPFYNYRTVKNVAEKVYHKVTQNFDIRSSMKITNHPIVLLSFSGSIGNDILYYPGFYVAATFFNISFDFGIGYNPKEDDDDFVGENL